MFHDIMIQTLNFLNINSIFIALYFIEIYSIYGMFTKFYS